MITFKKSGNNLSRVLVIGTIFFMGIWVSCETYDDQASENTVTTAEINFIGETTASGGGRIYNGGKAIVINRGICWDTKSMPTIQSRKTINGNGDGSFVSALTDLSPNTAYHVRAYASNTQGTSYGEEVTFTTKSSELPILQTTPISNITSNTGKSGGNIVFEGKTNVTSRGVCWSVNNPPTIVDNRTNDGSGIGLYTSTISGLDPDFSYYIRAYATNGEGTAYGNVLYLKPYKSTATDIDGNVYTTVSIGTQVWIVENLNVTKYQNGESIPNISDNALWNNTETGAYCDYDNNALNSNTFGRLYNWYATNDPRNIAPEGWHVATYTDYQVLVDYLGGPWEADEKMKNGGFNALPGGKRNRDGVFFDQGIYPYFWSSTEYHEGSAWARYVLLDGGELNIINLSKNYGFSVRCVRD